MRRLGVAAVVLAFGALVGGCGKDGEDVDSTSFSRSQADAVVDLSASALQFVGMPTTVEGPRVFFEVSNDSDVSHDLEVLAAPGGEMMGRIEPFGPGEVRTMAFDLPAGNYIVRCQEKLIDAPHSDLGMLYELVVE